MAGRRVNEQKNEILSRLQYPSKPPKTNFFDFWVYNLDKPSRVNKYKVK